jgi:hypothetical protein
MTGDNLGDRAIAAGAEQRDVPCPIAGKPIQLETRVWMPGSNHGDLVRSHDFRIPGLTSVAILLDSRLFKKNWRGRDGTDPSVDIAKDADQRF